MSQDPHWDAGFAKDVGVVSLQQQLTVPLLPLCNLLRRWEGYTSKYNSWEPRSVGCELAVIEPALVMMD